MQSRSGFRLSTHKSMLQSLDNSYSNLVLKILTIYRVICHFFRGGKKDVLGEKLT